MKSGRGLTSDGRQGRLCSAIASCTVAQLDLPEASRSRAWSGPQSQARQGSNALLRPPAARFASLSLLVRLEVGAPRARPMKGIIPLLTWESRNLKQQNLKVVDVKQEKIGLRVSWIY
jgi:hypothetical protein